MTCDLFGGLGLDNYDQVISLLESHREMIRTILKVITIVSNFISYMSASASPFQPNEVMSLFPLRSTVFMLDRPKEYIEIILSFRSQSLRLKGNFDKKYL